MLHRLSTAFLAVLFFGMIGLQLARADIYTWSDASGNINLSNIAPPEGVHVTNVVHATAPSPAAREAARQAEVQALEDRVRQLESAADLAQRRPPPQQMEYRPAQPPPVIQYIVNSAPPLAAYAEPPPPPNYGSSYGCDQAQFDCGLGGWPGFYPASVVFLPAASFRPFRSPVRGHPIAVRQPMRGGRVFQTR